MEAMGLSLHVKAAGSLLGSDSRAMTREATSAAPFHVPSTSDSLLMKRVCNPDESPSLPDRKTSPLLVQQPVDDDWLGGCLIVESPSH